MRDSNYNKFMVSTFSGLTVLVGHKEEIIMVNGEVVKFKYPEIAADNYRIRVTEDKQNRGMISGLSTKLFWILHG